jgi:L-threonylcarbamoyladenylate synthase
MHPDITRAAEVIRRGGLVAFPTETVYGLGANALDADAVDRIYAVKGRPPTSPLIVHVSSAEMARTVVSEWPLEAAVLSERYWPGPLTLILAKAPVVPARVTAGLNTVGVRVPAHPIALALIEAAGVPIAAPSANRFTEISPTTAQHVREGLGDDVELLLDGGPTEIGIESTVLSLAEGVPVLLRPGMVSRTAIEALIGPISIEIRNQGAHASPGLHLRHYSPRTPLILTSTPPSGRIACVWWRNRPDCARALRMPADPCGYAKNMYNVLHTLDREDWEFIVVEPVPEDDTWAAVRDRLIRAAAWQTR